MTIPQYSKPYEVNHESTIFFGKFKGQPHKVLLDEQNYCDWIHSTEPTFAEATKIYLRKHSM